MTLNSPTATQVEALRTRVASAIASMEALDLAKAYTEGQPYRRFTPETGSVLARPLVRGSGERAKLDTEALIGIQDLIVKMGRDLFLVRRHRANGCIEKSDIVSVFESEHIYGARREVIGQTGWLSSLQSAMTVIESALALEDPKRCSTFTLASIPLFVWPPPPQGHNNLFQEYVLSAYLYDFKSYWDVAQTKVLKHVVVELDSSGSLRALNGTVGVWRGELSFTTTTTEYTESGAVHDTYTETGNSVVDLDNAFGTALYRVKGPVYSFINTYPMRPIVSWPVGSYVNGTGTNVVATATIS